MFPSICCLKGLRDLATRAVTKFPSHTSHNSCTLRHFLKPHLPWPCHAFAAEILGDVSMGSEQELRTADRRVVDDRQVAEHD